VLQITKIQKAEIAAFPDDSTKELELEVTPMLNLSAERDEDKNDLNKSSVKLSQNLDQLMSDVNDLKSQIGYFSDEKKNDEKRIK
jgi:hypothetical protein